MSTYLDKLLDVWVPNVPGAAEAITAIVEGEIAAKTANLLAECEAVGVQCGEAERDLNTALNNLARAEADGALLRGAIAAQDEREQRAGERCGVSRGECGCDWPDVVADEVLTVRARAERAEADVATLRAALVIAAELLDRNGIHRPDIDAALTSGGQG